MSYYVGGARIEQSKPEERKIKLYGDEVPIIIALALRGHEGSRQLLANLSKENEWVVCCIRRPRKGEDPCYKRIDCRLEWTMNEDGLTDYGSSYSHSVGADVVELLLDKEGEILPNVWLERLEK